MSIDAGIGEAGERAQFGTAAGAVPDKNLEAAGKARRPDIVGAVGRLRHATMSDLALEQSRGAAFLMVPVLMGIGVLAYFSLPFEPHMMLVTAATVLPAVAFLLMRRREWARWAAASLFIVMLGMLCAQLETVRASTKLLGSEITTRLTGRIVTIEHQASGRIRLTLDVLATERPVLRYAPDRVRITARAIPDSVEPGDAVSGLVRLFPPQGPLQPDGYDFALESYFDGRGATGFFMGNPKLAEVDQPAQFRAAAAAWVERARAAIGSRIERSIEGDSGKIASALIAGLRDGIPEEVNEDLRRTGLAHILSISGLHMALVALTVMVTIRAGFAFFPVYSSNRPVKKYAAAVALVASAAYLLISGAEVAAQRSFIMLAVMLVAVMLDRSALTMRNLAISAIVVLAISPHEILGPSFQMSFAATAALIAGYAAWSERRRNRPAQRFEPVSGLAWLRRKTTLYVGGLVLTSILAGGATTLYGIWHFQRMSPLSLVANLAVMPIVSVLVMPFALLAALLMPLGLEAWPLAVMGKGLDLMLAAANWLSERSPLDETGMIPKSAVILFTVALIVVSVCTTRLRLLALPFLVMGSAVAIGRDLPQVFISEDARLVAVATGQGSLAVNRTRPSNFTTDNWRRAVGADLFWRATTIREASPAELAAHARQKQGFACGEGACAAELPGGGIVALVEEGDALSRWCPLAILIVLQDAAHDGDCGEAAIVIGARELARQGAVEITLSQGSGADRIVRLRHAVAEPFRPWHAHRVYSRSARGLRPYERRKKPVARPDAGKGSTSQAPGQAVTAATNQ